MHRRHPYLIAASGIADAQIMPKNQIKGGAVGAKIVYGMEGSFMVATREGGYHSAPHRHDCEQMNYVEQGAIWIFFEHGGFLASQGDFFRIPRNVVHWSWIVEGAPCTLIESHVPPLTGDASNAASAVGLFDDSEDTSGVKHIATTFVTVDSAGEIEERTMREWRLAAE